MLYKVIGFFSRKLKKNIKYFNKSFEIYWIFTIKYENYLTVVYPIREYVNIPK